MLLIRSDFDRRVTGDHFSLLYHHGDADSCTNPTRLHCSAHVWFACGAHDLAGYQIKITVEHRDRKVGCHQIWNCSYFRCGGNCTSGEKGSYQIPCNYPDLTVLNSKS